MYIPEPKKTKTGYRIQLRINGESIPVTAETIKECKRKAAAIKADAQGESLKVKTSNLTLSEAIDVYIDERKNSLSPSTIRGYRAIQKNRFKETMPRRIRAIPEKDWRKIVDAELGVASKKTVKNAWAFLKSVLRAQGIEVDDTVKVAGERKKSWCTVAGTG